MDKNYYYLDIAEAVGRKSTCLRRKYGAIVVKNDEIIATGYNGSPRGCVNCTDVGYCMRNILGIGKGDAYNLCLSVHAEMNCLISSKRTSTLGATMYIVGVECESGNYADPQPCMLCHRMIINAGIANVYGLTGTKDSPGIVECDCSVQKFNHRIYDEYIKVASTMTDVDCARIMKDLAAFPL